MDLGERAIARLAGAPPRNAQEIDIVSDGDFIIQLYKPSVLGELCIGASGDLIPGSPMAAFKVSRQVLIENSPRLKLMVRAAGAQKNSHAIDIPCATIKSFELCFRSMHFAMTEEMKCLNIKEMREALKFCEDWDFVLYHLDNWYAEWLQRRNIKTFNMDELRQLLYPFQEFNDAEAFAYATKELVYEQPKSITEMNPTDHGEFQLEPKVIDNMNDARDGIKSSILKALFDPIDNALKLTCPCKDASLVSWCKALSKSGIWPLADHDTKSVRDILQHPGTIHFRCVLPAEACEACKANFQPSKISRARDGSLTTFDGMCLDCMARSKGGQNGTNRSYWVHDTQRQWDTNCRINHGQATWFFSFLGKKKDMDDYENRKMNMEGRA